MAALDMAALNGHIKAMGVLIEAKVKDNMGGHTPLHLAVSSGYTQGVEMLIQAKANLEVIHEVKRQCA